MDLRAKYPGSLVMVRGHGSRGTGHGSRGIGHGSRGIGHGSFWEKINEGER